MRREELICLENYRLKNQITDLRNALAMNRDFLVLLSKQEKNAQEKVCLLYKIIIRLTQQSDDALLANLELIQEKEALKQQVFKLGRQLDETQRKLAGQIQKFGRMCSPTESKFMIQEQLQSLNVQLLASLEQKMELQEEVAYWKRQYNNLEASLRESTQAQEPLLCAQELLVDKQSIKNMPNTVPRRRKISRKYTSSIRLMGNEKVSSLQKQIRSLKRYIDELEGRLQIFIKAYELEENVFQRKKSRPSLCSSLRDRTDLQLNLLKFGMNEMRVVEKQGEKFIVVRHNFVGEQAGHVSERRNRKSWPKYKQYPIDSQCQDQFFNTISARLQAQSS